MAKCWVYVKEIFGYLQLVNFMYLRGWINV